MTVLFSVSAAHAGNTWQVDKTRNSGLCNGDNRVCTSLKEAVAAAESGDKITISANRYDAENDILIEDKNLQIIGAGQPQIVSLGPGNGTMVDEQSGTQIYAYNICPTCSQLTLLGRVFRVKNSTVSVSNMWISGGSSGDGGAVLIESGGKVTFRNVKITGQTGSGASGGAIYNNGGTLNLNNSYIIGISGSIHQSDNKVGGSGGGLFNKGGTVMIADSVFQFCKIWGAGNGNMPGTTPNRRGFSAGNGGAVYNDAAGEVIIIRSDFSNNEAGAGGAGGNGAFLNTGAGFDGATGGTGGAIHNEGSMYISDSSIAFNAAGKGGAGGFSTSNPAVGAGGGLGGGIFNDGNLNLVNSTVSSNKAGDGGTGGSSDTANGDNGGPGGSAGGIYNLKTLEMTNVTVSANTTGAGGSGGTGGYISNGAAGSSGGGGGVINGAEVLFDFTVIPFKTTVVEGNTSAKNTIIAGNTTASGGKYPDVFGQFYSNGYNLIGIGYDESNFRNDGDQKGSTAAPLDAKLGVLGANGGRGSSVSYDLLPGSPAIDAGDDSVTEIPWELAYDQRGAGFTRKFGSHVDIGAIETFPPNTAPTASAQTVSLNEDIAKAITLSASDAENDSLTYTVTNPSHGTLSGTAPNLTYTPNADYNGNDSFTFKANDGEFNSNVATVTITVAAVNDAPSFIKGANQTVNEDAGAQSIANWATSISKGPANESDQTVGFEVSNNNNNLFSAQPAVSPAGVLSYTSAANASGTATVTLRIKDSGGTANGGVDASATQTFTITVNAVNDAPLAVNDKATQSLQYSDAMQTVNIGGTDIDSHPLTASVSFTKDGGSTQAGLPTGMTLSSPANCTASTVQLIGTGTSCGWTVSGIADAAAGSYLIRVTVTDADLSSASTSFTVVVNKEKTATDYTGDFDLMTAGPAITDATVRLAATLTQEADNSLGDISKATVTFKIFKFNATTASYIVPNIPVDSNGDAQYLYTLPADVYTIRVEIDGGNGYWTADPINEGMLNITVATDEQRSSGGGWIPDAASANGKAHFAFSVSSTKNGKPKGNVSFRFKGDDGFNYLVKSNSWQGGYLQFSAELNVKPAVYTRSNLKGSCNVQKIDPATDKVVESFGNYTFEIFTRDGDLLNPRQGDAYSITVRSNTNAVIRQFGSPDSLVPLGGGNITNKIK